MLIWRMPRQLARIPLPSDYSARLTLCPVVSLSPSFPLAFFPSAGKSTLVKLMVGELAPCEGRVDIKSGVSIGRFHQHSTDILDLELSPLDYIARRFAERYPDRKLQDWRSAVGQWGISSEYQTQVRFLRALMHCCMPAEPVVPLRARTSCAVQAQSFLVAAHQRPLLALYRRPRTCLRHLLLLPACLSLCLSLPLCLSLSRTPASACRS